MEKYKINVEKNYYRTGFVIVEAENSMEALHVIDMKIINDELNDDEIEWNENFDEIPETLTTTGDIDFVKRNS